MTPRVLGAGSPLEQSIAARGAVRRVRVNQDTAPVRGPAPTVLRLVAKCATRCAWRNQRAVARMEKRRARQRGDGGDARRPERLRSPESSVPSGSAASASRRSTSSVVSTGGGLSTGEAAEPGNCRLVAVALEMRGGPARARLEIGVPQGPQRSATGGASAETPHAWWSGRWRSQERIPKSAAISALVSGESQPPERSSSSANEPGEVRPRNSGP